MKAGRIPHAPEMPRIPPTVDECLEKMFWDELTYGVSGCHFSEDGDIQRLDPMVVEEIIRFRKAQEDMHTENLTIDEVLERYPLTEEQIQKLKRL